MIALRRAAERGRTRLDWLDSRHTFSFGEYYDERHMGFRSLRVINEDRVAPGAGFPTHSHRDMEILSYVVSGALEHRDSLGTGSVIRPGDVQRMSAGRGVSHSEYNPSPAEPVHFLQIWILPEARGVAPSYEQRAFDETGSRGKLLCVASRDGREGSVRIHQDAAVYLTRLGKGERVSPRIARGRGAWVQVVAGQLDLNGTRMVAGDGTAVEGESSVGLFASEDCEALLFDLA